MTDVNDVVFHRDPFELLALLAPHPHHREPCAMRGEGQSGEPVRGAASGGLVARSLRAEHYDLFVGDEAESSMAFALRAFHRCFRRPEDRASTRASGAIFNSGVVGGTAEAVAWLLAKVEGELQSTLVDEERGADARSARPPWSRRSFACDMSALNKVLWGVLTRDPRYAHACADDDDDRDDDECTHPLFWRVFSGYPLVSPFKGSAPPRGWHYIAHK